MRFDRHYQLIDPEQQVVLNKNFAFAKKPYQGISGPQKLVNRFVKKLFTPKGTNYLFPKDGTQYPFLIDGNVSPDDNLEASIQLCVDDCSEQIRDVDGRSPWLTNDERLANASIIQFERVGIANIEFWVSITTVSGKKVLALIPYTRI